MQGNLNFTFFSSNCIASINSHFLHSFHQLTFSSFHQLTFSSFHQLSFSSFHLLTFSSFHQLMLCSGIPNCLTTWTTTSPNISTHLCEESYSIVVEAVTKLEFEHDFFLMQNTWLPSFQKVLNIYSLESHACIRRHKSSSI